MRNQALFALFALFATETSASSAISAVDPIPDPWVNHCELVTSKSSQDDKNLNVCSAEVAEVVP